jgi:hypothetical protein
MMSGVGWPIRLSDRDTHTRHRQADRGTHPRKPENIDYGCSHIPSLSETEIMAENNLKSLCRLLKSFETKRLAVSA